MSALLLTAPDPSTSEASPCFCNGIQILPPCSLAVVLVSSHGGASAVGFCQVSCDSVGFGECRTGWLRRLRTSPGSRSRRGRTAPRRSAVSRRTQVLICPHHLSVDIFLLCMGISSEAVLCCERNIFALDPLCSSHWLYGFVLNGLLYLQPLERSDEAVRSAWGTALQQICLIEIR